MDLAFERIVNVPKRGLGDTTMQMLHDYARQHEVPLLEAARVISSTDELKPKPRTSLRDLIAQFDRWRVELDELEKRRRIPSSPASCSTSPVTRRCGRTTSRRRRRAGSKT
jgi:superfamily I DNA/RNA helicase